MEDNKRSDLLRNSLIPSIGSFITILSYTDYKNKIK
jgi:hypothetical protein